MPESDTSDDPLTNDNSSSTTSVSIKSYTAAEDALGEIVIYGEVQNTGDIGATYVKINASFKDASGTLLDTDYTFADPSTIPAGKTYGFVIYGDATYSAVSTVNLTVSYSGTTSNNPESGLSISNVSDYTDSLGDIRILGEVTNTTGELKTYCDIQAIFYDGAGKVVYNDFTFADPSSIASGYTNTFELYTNISPSEYSSYRLYSTSPDND